MRSTASSTYWTSACRSHQARRSRSGRNIATRPLISTNACTAFATERSKRFCNYRADRQRMPKKWQLCVVLFLATTLNYLDRQTMSILAPSLQRELHLDNQALGWLFAVFY